MIVKTYKHVLMYEKHFDNREDCLNFIWGSLQEGYKVVAFKEKKNWFQKLWEWIDPQKNDPKPPI